MALEYKKLKDALEKAPLTSEELAIISEVEKFIDGEIQKQFKGGEVSIDLEVANFNYKIGMNGQRDIPNFRKNLMSKELDSRYIKAGWKIRNEINEDDGPNRPAIDYWVITGKN